MTTVDGKGMRSARVISAAALAATALSVLAPASRAGTAKPGFKTGTYVGTTSQNEPIKFKIEKTSCYPASASENGNGHPERGYCYVRMLSNVALNENYPTLNQTCSDGSTETDQAYAAGFELLLSKAGSVTYTRQGFDVEDQSPSQSTSTFTLHVSGSKATGTITQTDQVTESVSCTNPTVTFSASRT